MQVCIMGVYQVESTENGGGLDKKEKKWRAENVCLRVPLLAATILLNAHI